MEEELLERFNRRCFDGTTDPLGYNRSDAGAGDFYPCEYSPFESTAGKTAVSELWSAEPTYIP